MSILAASFALALAGGLHAQDPPIFPQGKYVVRPDNWVEYRVEVVSGAPKSSSVACTNPCNGKKHTLHAECDAKCDGACTAIHKYTFEPSYLCLPGGDIKDAGAKMGLPDVTFELLDQAMKQVRAGYIGSSKSYDLKHWCKDPCSDSSRSQALRDVKIQAKYQFYRNDPGPNDTKILVKGPGGTWDIGLATIPEGEMSEPDTRVRCRCSIVQGDGQGAGVWIEKGGETFFATTQVIEQYGIKVECTSMNSCTITCTNTTGESCDVTIGAGTVFECVDGSLQDESLCEKVEFTCQAYSTVTARASIAPVDPVSWLTSVNARAACLNMRKHEPKAGTPYRFGSPRDPGTVALAEIVAAERFRGPWDQVRFWILTDHASREEMGRILLPRPTYGMMLRCLYDVHRATGTDLTASEFKNCFEASAVIGASASQEATDWYVATWASKDPKGLANWLNKNASLLTAECFGPDTGKDEATHAADLFNALCWSGNPDLIEAAATCLLKAVPAEKRKLLAECGGLVGMMGLLMDADEKAASRALDVAEAYGEPIVKSSLLNVNDTQIERNKERAFKLYQELG